MRMKQGVAYADVGPHAIIQPKLPGEDGSNSGSNDSHITSDGRHANQLDPWHSKDVTQQQVAM